MAYTLSETANDGYSEGAWSCDGNNGIGGSGAYNDATVTLDLGENVTCQITNDDVGDELIFEDGFESN